MNDDETTPLLQPQQVQVSHVEQLEYSVHEEEPPPYSRYDTESRNPPSYYALPTAPSTSEGSSLVPHLNCRVCQTVLNVEGKLHLHVIKCSSCGEATPIRPAPAGKKYVRCPCNCLLICKTTSQRIICPRPNCKRVNSLASSGSHGGTPSQAIRRNPTRRILCAYCNASFVWVQPGDTCGRCPHCSHHSSFGPRYRSARIRLNLVFGIIALALAIFVTIGVVYCTEDRGWSRMSYIVVCLLYAVAIVFLSRAIRYSFVKVSTIERPQLQYT